MFKTIIIRGLDEFSRNADPFDFLGAVSPHSHPLGHSKNLSSACRRLYPNSELVVVFVAGNDGEPVAALPLIERKRLGVTTLELPNNEWGCWGELLTNPAFESDIVYDALVDGLDQIPHFGLRLNLVHSESGHWKRMLGALKSVGRGIETREAYSIGMIDHAATWNGFRKRLSKGMRKKLSKFKRLIGNRGEVTFEVHRQFGPSEVEMALGRVFDVEQRSWKTTESTSTADHGMVEFYTEQATMLAEQGSLCVSFLKLDDQDVAFEFGMIADRVYYSYKIGFDKQFKECSPGHLLAEHLTEYFHSQNVCDVQDTVGPISEATARWSSRVKRISNVTVSGNISGAKIALRTAYAAKRIMKRRAMPVGLPVLGTTPMEPERVSQQVSGMESSVNSPMAFETV